MRIIYFGFAFVVTDVEANRFLNHTFEGWFNPPVQFPGKTPDEKYLIFPMTPVGLRKAKAVAEVARKEIVRLGVTPKRIVYLRDEV